MKPTAAAQLAALAIEHGWAVQAVPGTDTGNSPFITVLAIRGDERLELTWHTRNTGTYRLMHATTGKNLGARTITIAKARQQIEASNAD